MPGIINLSSYTYHLPEERIAKFPASDRTSSRLLYYHRGHISHRQFTHIGELLPSNSSLFLNNTKVIPARMTFKKDTGALIEIFLLQPVSPTPIISLAMEATGPVVWKCMIGNAKRWKEGALKNNLLVDGRQVLVTIEKEGADLIKIHWNDPSARFSEVIEAMGKTPLPPYLNRQPTEADKISYQTVYSNKEGAVAAPTAGLHFTGGILENLRSRGIETHFLTLHVSAGTFQPIKTENVTEHNMHSEQIVATRQNIQQLMADDRFCVAVGTTSLRTIESIYWYGVKLLHDPEADFHIPKLFPYEQRGGVPANSKILGAVLKRMDELQTDEIVGSTEIFIFPGYTFRLVKGLITNFHQPQSTLILLVAAFVGDDWRKIYEEALANNYRFLSYGDSSLLIPSN